MHLRWFMTAKPHAMRRRPGLLLTGLFVAFLIFGLYAPTLFAGTPFSANLPDDGHWVRGHFNGIHLDELESRLTKYRGLSFRRWVPAGVFNTQQLARLYAAGNAREADECIGFEPSWWPSRYYPVPKHGERSPAISVPIWRDSMMTRSASSTSSVMTGTSPGTRRPARMTS